MDSASLQLLKALWSGNNGILMVGGYRDDLAKKVSKSENIMDVLAEFSGSERYSVVPLKDIDYRAVCGLATDIFVAKEVPNVEESIYGRIFLMSGGNPLYAYELTTALTDKYHNELASGAVNILATLLTQFNSDRIEEVITYRFDQLESTLQLAIKMATVASSNGATFTVDMISYMMYEDRYVSSSVMTTEDTQKKLQETKDVAELLLTAVNRHEFIRVSDRRFISPLSSGMASVSGSFSFGENFQTKSEEQELSLENIFDASFEFINELERVCIYDLMLDDQKESLHDRVASYLERDSTRGIGEATAADKYEEAHHWEMAKAWSSAMSCYYKSAMLLNDFGAYTDSFQHLSLAYRMLIAMRRDAGVEDNTDILPASFNDLFNRQPIESKSVPDLHVSQDHNSEKAKTGVPLARSMSVGIPKSQSRLSKLDIYRVFGGDSGLLETGLNVLLRLGQASFTLNENPIIASKLYEEALQLITITWSNSSVLAKNRISTPKTHKLYMKENSSDRIDGQDSTMFGLKDPTICFPILAGVAALYRNGKLKDDNKRSKEAAICQLFTTLAESSTEDIYQMHRLQGLSITTALYLELGRIDDAKVIADTIKASYDYQKFSSKLVDAYGNDRVPYTVAIVLQDLKMKGDLPTSMDYIDFLLNLGPKMSHLHSLGILAYPLCSVLIQVGYTSEAEDLFASYVNMEESRGGFSFFRPVNPLVMESLRLMNCYKNNTVDCRRKLENNIETSTQLLTKVRGKEYIFDNHQRPLVYQVVDSFGFAAEFLCAELLFYHSKYVLSHGQENIESTEDKCSENESDIFKNEVIDDLKLSLEYLEEALQYHEDVVRYRYSHYNCLLLKAEVLTLLSEFAASDAVEMSSGEIKNQAKEILISLHDMVKDFNFFQVRLKTGLYLVRLQLDEELGASIIKRTLADVLEAVGEKLFLGRFEYIKKLFPIVLNYESEIMCEKLKEASQSDQ